MTQFGKRTPGGSSRVSSRPETLQADVAAALAAVKAGKLPTWATVSPARLMIIAFGAAAVLWFITVSYAGAILRDYRLAGTWQVAYDLRVTDASCRRINFLVTFCTTKIASLAEPDQAPVASEFMMGFSSGGGEAVVPVRSTVDPAAVTVAYAAETKLTNRTLTLIVIAGLLAAPFIMTLRALLQGRYKGGRAHRALLVGFAELQERMGVTPAAQRATP